MSADNPEKARRGMGRVAFHALRDTIRTEIEAGYMVRMIYERHQDALPISYEQLRAYIAREITGTAGSRGGRTLGRKSTAPTNGQTTLPRPAQAPELVPPTHSADNQDKPYVIRVEERTPKRIVTRIPDLDRLAYGSKGKPKD